MIRSLEHESQAKTIVPQILRDGDDLAEEVPCPIIIDVFYANLFDEVVSKMTVFIENARDETYEFRLPRFRRLFHEIGRHEGGDGERLQLPVILLIHQSVANL